jgi:hypothetical protein
MNNNTELANQARDSLLRVLSDGKWHQAKDLKIETCMSSKTLYKKLEQLKPFYDKETREEGKLKPTVYYRANPTLMRMLFQIEYNESAWEDLKEEFLETKDFSKALRTVDNLTHTSLIIALLDIQNKTFDATNPTTLELFLDSSVWSTYQQLTLNLVDLCVNTKIIDEVNFAEVAKKLTEN